MTEAEYIDESQLKQVGTKKIKVKPRVDEGPSSACPKH